MGQNENYGQFLNMLELVMLMQQSARGIGLDEIESHFGVKRRTAERMRDAVARFFPADFIVSNDGIRKYFKLRAKRLDALTLSSVGEDHLAALSTAADLLRRHSLDDQARLTEEARGKLASLIKIKPSVAVNLEDRLKSEGLAASPGPKMVYQESLLRILREAIMTFHLIEIDYAAKSRDKQWTLIPLGFLFGERNHYLVARYANTDSKEVFHFILDRIKGARRLSETFEEDPSFSLTSHAALAFGAFQEPPFEVEWHFKSEAANEAARFIFHPTQKLTILPGGSLKVTFTAGGRLEMAWHLYTWGDLVKVVKPQDFWDRLPPGYLRPPR
ncbi:MAG: WYL domain-containing protein [Deltaproteobacteria bacterium]|jgi:predicted DNA-binding transcriptional regulator YafY|nr:WYL domain-containing protein [Deltaproteobacteria bacterium]